VDSLKERLLAVVEKFKHGPFADDVTLIVVSIGDDFKARSEASLALGEAESTSTGTGGRRAS
jgi:hypothetical protein